MFEPQYAVITSDLDNLSKDVRHSSNQLPRLRSCGQLLCPATSADVRPWSIVIRIERIEVLSRNNHISTNTSRKKHSTAQGMFALSTMMPHVNRDPNAKSKDLSCGCRGEGSRFRVRISHR